MFGGSVVYTRAKGVENTASPSTHNSRHLLFTMLTACRKPYFIFLIYHCKLLLYIYILYQRYSSSFSTMMGSFNSNNHQGLKIVTWWIHLYSMWLFNTIVYQCTVSTRLQVMFMKSMVAIVNYIKKKTFVYSNHISSLM